MSAACRRNINVNLLVHLELRVLDSAILVPMPQLCHTGEHDRQHKGNLQLDLNTNDVQKARDII